VGALHILACNGANRRDLQALIEPSVCNFEVIFNVGVALVFQPRQLSVAALHVYSSSTTFFILLRRSGQLLAAQ
jgi:hypothetical protein